MTDYAARRTMMVDTQVRPSDVTKFPIIDALLTIPREAFVPREKREMAYVGENIEVAPGRVMLEPRTLAKMLDALNISNEDLCLVLASGTGYSAAVVAHIAEAVVAVEEDETLSADAESTLQDLSIDNVIAVQGPLTDPAGKHGPYDVVLIEGAVETVPQAILDSLSEGGRIACLFAEGALGVVRIGYRIDGAITWRFAFNAGAPVLEGFAKETAFSL